LFFTSTQLSQNPDRYELTLLKNLSTDRSKIVTKYVIYIIFRYYDSDNIFWVSWLWLLPVPSYDSIFLIFRSSSLCFEFWRGQKSHITKVSTPHDNQAYDELIELCGLLFESTGTSQNPDRCEVSLLTNHSTQRPQVARNYLVLKIFWVYVSDSIGWVSGLWLLLVLSYDLIFLIFWSFSIRFECWRDQKSHITNVLTPQDTQTYDELIELSDLLLESTGISQNPDRCEASLLTNHSTQRPQVARNYLVLKIFWVYVSDSIGWVSCSWLLLVSSYDLIFLIFWSFSIRFECWRDQKSHITNVLTPHDNQTYDELIELCGLLLESTGISQNPDRCEVSFLESHSLELFKITWNLMMHQIFSHYDSNIIVWTSCFWLFPVSSHESIFLIWCNLLSFFW
jgi:hypothetical protein